MVRKIISFWNKKEDAEIVNNSCYYCGNQEKLSLNSNGIYVCGHCETIISQTKKKVLACC